MNLIAWVSNLTGLTSSEVAFALMLLLFVAMWAYLIAVEWLIERVIGYRRGRRS